MLSFLVNLFHLNKDPLKQIYPTIIGVRFVINKVKRYLTPFSKVFCEKISVAWRTNTFIAFYEA
jgi:hypothetical protein